MSFIPDQRWQSRTEPELGLGIVVSVEGREVVIAYPARDVVRRYAAADAPLTRARLSEGQQARGTDGTSLAIEQVVDLEGLLVYRGEGQELHERDLDAGLDVASPENRMCTGQVDDYRLFDLRHDALAIRHQMLASPTRGFLGGRIHLFDHQLAIARDVCGRHRVRVMLADEVGLGKTIEALLVLNQMLLTGRIERVLVIVPPALVHQWLAEAFLRFNLVLRVIGRETHGGGAVDLESEELLADLLRHQLFVCPLGAEASESLVNSPWDLVIVDEAHHLEVESAQFRLVEGLAARVEHVVLLSATPDRDGEEAHFRRLALLDPARFDDFTAYRRDAEHYRELADTAERLQRGGPLSGADRDLLRERLPGADIEERLAHAATDRGSQRELLSRLLDLHGLGRAMFRNLRARVPGFPRRVAVACEIADGDASGPYAELLREEFLYDIGQLAEFEFHDATRDPRTLWLQTFLDAHPHRRVLVLCSTRDKAQAFADALAAGKREIARFHEGMSTIERDRQAAWFLAADGPQILVSSAIGAEGRNFQVAGDLVLLDLPLQADRLEQLIGRVDRIGQGDEVRIHCPVVAGTPQARLRRWYDEALRVFERPWHGSLAIERDFGERLVEALLATGDAAIDALIIAARKRNEQVVADLEGGRDRLLELTSFDAEAAAKLRDSIADAENSDELESFMVDAFERAGLDIEVLERRSYALRAGVDYHRPFPGFIGTEMGMTFDRSTALLHPELTLVTWDHPMLRDTVDDLLAHDTGNAAIANLAADRPGLLLEAIFVAEPTLPRALRADRFFPPTPVRVVVDASGSECDLRTTELRRCLRPSEPALLEHPQIVERLQELIGAARAVATERGPDIAEDARTKMRLELEPTVTRLQHLAAAGDASRRAELDTARAELEELDAGLTRLRLRLDALRLLVAGAG